MRETARNLCTADVGNRSLDDLEREKEAALRSPRWTRLDEKIKDLCGGGFRPDLSKSEGKERERIVTRLEALRKLKLCDYIDGGYRLKGRWDEALRNNGRYNAFLKARNELKHPAPSRLRLDSGIDGEITGKVTKIYRTDDDASDNHAVVIESDNGLAYFVPLFKAPEVRDGDKKAALKEGDEISLRTYKTQKGRLTPVMETLASRERSRQDSRNKHHRKPGLGNER
jgi:hypothetical protein